MQKLSKAKKALCMAIDVTHVGTGSVPLMLHICELLYSVQDIKEASFVCTFVTAIVLLYTCHSLHASVMMPKHLANMQCPRLCSI